MLLNPFQLWVQLSSWIFTFCNASWFSVMSLCTSFLLSPLPIKNHPIFLWLKTIHWSQNIAIVLSGSEVLRQTEQTEQNTELMLQSVFFYSRGHSSQVFLSLPSFIQMLNLKQICESILVVFFKFLPVWNTYLSWANSQKTEERKGWSKSDRACGCADNPSDDFIGHCWKPP